MLTSKELAAELSRRGYRVNARLLTKWRADGLLPPLARTKSGHGRRPKYAWQGPDILDRAVAICQLLARHRRVATALLMIWFAGYAADPVRVRDAWIERLNGPAAAMEDDAVVLLAERASKQEMSRIDAAPGDMERLLNETLPLVFTPNYSLSNMDLSPQFFDLVYRILAAITKDPLVKEVFGRTAVTSALQTINETLSLTAIRRLIEATTDEELIAAHRRWENAIRVIGSVAAASLPQGVWGDFPFGPRQPAMAFGGFFLLALLYLDKRGAGPRLDATLARIAAALADIPASGLKLAVLESGTDAAFILQDAATDVEGIWSGFDFRSLLTPSSRR